MKAGASIFQHSKMLIDFFSAPAAATVSFLAWGCGNYIMLQAPTELLHTPTAAATSQVLDL